MWFTGYSSTLPQLPWQQHSLGPAGKIPHPNLAPVSGSRRACATGEEPGHGQGELGIDLAGPTVESLYRKVACRAKLRKWLLFFPLLAINACTPGQTGLGSLTLRRLLMAYVPTARQASALPAQPPQRSLLRGWRCRSKPQRAGRSPRLPLACSDSAQWSAESRAGAWPARTGNVSPFSEI